MMIKWINDKPYIYKSTTLDSGEQKDVYQCSYQEYRQKHLSESFNDVVKLKTIDKWIKENPERIEHLLLIDAGERL